MKETQLLEKAKKYLENEKDSYFREDLETVIKAGNFDELNDRFFKTLEFGTAGLRGVIGGGDNRMNPYNISKAAQGLANYINKNVSGKKDAVVAYDSRLFSTTFADTVAMVLAANGIHCYLFSSLRPTPELSFAIRYLNCTTGAVVTASHNPSEYNGFKVYWNNGGQIIEPHDTGIIKEVEAVSSINLIDKQKAIDSGLITIIDKEIDDAFISTIEKYLLRKELFTQYADATKIVYTPLNGTGLLLVKQMLSKLGVPVVIVKEQEEPDGNFPTCPYPNPEIAEALELACKLGKEQRAAIVMGTDPDADRLGIAVPDFKQESGFTLITGNQLGSMLCYYLLNTLSEFDKLPQQGGIVKTIVTTNLASDIATSFGVKVANVLTGFKWIASAMDKFEEEGTEYIFGFEESYGFNMLKEVRDKDAIGTVALCVEMALYCASKNKTLLDYLNEIYLKYGYYEEFQISKTFKGESGLITMKNLMDELRNRPLNQLGCQKVVILRDYLSGKEISLDTKEENEIDLPSSNVLQYQLDDGSLFTIRPSGTEPKIKFYGSCRVNVTYTLDEAKYIARKKIEAIKERVEEILKEF